MDIKCICLDTFVSQRIFMKKSFGLKVNHDKLFNDIHFRLNSLDIFKSIRTFVRRCLREHVPDKQGHLCSACNQKILVYHRLMETIEVWKKCWMCNFKGVIKIDYGDKLFLFAAYGS